MLDTSSILESRGKRDLWRGLCGEMGCSDNLLQVVEMGCSDSFISANQSS